VSPTTVGACIWHVVGYLCQRPQHADKLLPHTGPGGGTPFTFVCLHNQCLASNRSRTVID